MNPKVNYLIVGLFVILLGAATLIFALWLAFGYGEGGEKTYVIYMRESVTGLTKDADVKFNGVDVGEIKDITLAPTDPSVVMVHILVKDHTPVTVDTRATLMSQGLTGLSYINLSGGDVHSPLLRALPGQPYPVIPTNPSLFLRLDTVVNRLDVSLEKMSAHVDSLLNEQNQQNFALVLQNLAKISGTAANHDQSLARALDTLPHLLDSANQTLTLLNTETLPQMNASLAMMHNILPGVNGLVQQVSDNPSVLLRGQKSQELGPGEEIHA